MKQRPKNCSPSNHRVELELERVILKGLVQEWHTRSDDLPQSIAEKLKPPTFRLSDMSSRWGYWESDQRQIVLSRKLVLNYPWDSVLEILLHEMAHQVADQGFLAHHQRPHGPLFREACRLLNANPAVTGACPPLEERISGNAHHPPDGLVARIDKLLSLAQSSHRHEAEAAMLKAHELIAKYNIDLVKIGMKRQFTSAFVGLPALRHYQDDYELANLLQDHYFVRGIWVRAYVTDREKMGRVLEISGTIKNVSIARHVHTVLSRKIKSEWTRYRAENEAPARARLDFILGIIRGFEQKVSGQIEKLTADPDSGALIRLGDSQLESYFKQRYPRTRNINRRARQKYAEALIDGQRIGRRIVISKALVDKRQQKVNRLPAK